jgi:hypothetical protein
MRPNKLPKIPPISGPRDGDRPLPKSPPAACDSVGTTSDRNNVDETSSMSDDVVIGAEGETEGEGESDNDFVEGDGESRDSENVKRLDDMIGDDESNGRVT